MTKWLKIGAALLLLAWAPFIYAELTSSPAEKKARELPSVDDRVDDMALEPAEEPVAAPEESPEPAKTPDEDEEHAAPDEQAADDHGSHDEPVEQGDEAQEPAAEAAALEPGPDDDQADPAVAEEELVAGEDEAAEDAPPPVAKGPTAQLRHAFETEPRDALWAKDAERSIAAIFDRAEAPEGMLDRAGCRRAVCRIDVRWSAEHAAQYAGAYEALGEQFGSEIAVEPKGELEQPGQHAVHLYVLRKGYTAADLTQ